MNGATFQYNKIGGSVKAPSSKSYSQRMILLSAISGNPVTLRGISFCDDEIAAVNMARDCGSEITTDGDALTIEPHFRCPSRVNVGESATLYRISMGMLAAMGCRTEFVGAPSLAGRPMEPLIHALEKAGVRLLRKDDGFYSMDARERKNIEFHMDQGISSQFISSLIFYNAAAGNDLPMNTTAEQVSASYIDITLHALDMLGYGISREDGAFQFTGKHLSGKEFQVEGDFSSALFPVVLGSLCSQGGVRITGLNPRSRQADRIALDTLVKASTGISAKSNGNNLEIEASRSDFELIEVDASRVPDSCPPISVIGIFSDNGIRILNYERLRAKESDRVSAIKEIVTGFGAAFLEGNRSISVKRGINVFPEEYHGNDHRMLMSAITAGLVARSSTKFFNLDAVRKSYPGFLNDLKLLGVSAKPV